MMDLKEKRKSIHILSGFMKMTKTWSAFKNVVAEINPEFNDPIRQRELFAFWEGQLICENLNRELFEILQLIESE